MNVTQMVEYLMCMYGKFDSIETERFTGRADIQFTTKRGNYKQVDIFMDRKRSDEEIKTWLMDLIYRFDSNYIRHSDSIKYIKHDIKTTKEAWTKVNPYLNFNRNTTIKKVIFNNPATIVLWTDGTKTVVKCQNDEIFDPEKGLAMAIAKKAFGNKSNYCNEIKKWTDEYWKENGIKTSEVDLDPATAEAVYNQIKEHFEDADEKVLNAPEGEPDGR